MTAAEQYRLQSPDGFPPNSAAAVHWPASWDSLSQLWQGYAISNDGAGNYKLPLIYVIMLLPLLFSGGGKFSLDNLLAKIANYSEVGKLPIKYWSQNKPWKIYGYCIKFILR